MNKLANFLTRAALTSVNKLIQFKLASQLLLFALLTCSTAAYGQDNEQLDKEALAKQLSNPVAALISVPIQYNYDENIGADDNGSRTTINIQPVIPFSLNKDWNIISRTILPVIEQKDIYPGAGKQSGIGDIVQSIFFSPKAPTSDGWIWGAGPVILLPTGSDDMLTVDKLGLGPTAVALKQQGPWTYGALANHIWSVGGKSNSADVNATFFQPFLVYTTKTATTFSLNTESTYDWESKQLALPINLTATQMVKIGGQLISVGGGIRYWAKSTDNGPEGLGVRLMFTMLFPK
ncbi:transporter [Colwelliaceae bacterium MEBiC 14330]